MKEWEYSNYASEQIKARIVKNHLALSTSKRFIIDGCACFDISHDSTWNKPISEMITSRKPNKHEWALTDTYLINNNAHDWSIFNTIRTGSHHGHVYRAGVNGKFDILCWCNQKMTTKHIVTRKQLPLDFESAYQHFIDILNTTGVIRMFETAKKQAIKIIWTKKFLLTMLHWTAQQNPVVAKVLNNPISQHSFLVYHTSCSNVPLQIRTIKKVKIPQLEKRKERNEYLKRYRNDRMIPDASKVFFTDEFIHFFEPQSGFDIWIIWMGLRINDGDFWNCVNIARC